MQFITDNYIWFFVAGIIILMTVIGYIAEKTDFGHKEVKKTESKEKKLKKDVKEMEQSNLKLNDVVYSENTKDVEIIDVNKVEEVDAFAFNDLTNVPKEENLNVSLNGVEEDLTVPLSGKVEDVQNPLIGVEEDLTVPLSGNVEEKVENIGQVVEEDLTVPLNNNTIVEEINETQKEEKNEISNDDIWKF